MKKSYQINAVVLVACATLLLASASVSAFQEFKYHVIKSSGYKGGGTSLIDVDKDGDLDLIFPKRGGAYYCYEFKSASSWSEHTIGSPTDTDVGGSSADIDGDGKPDAVTDKKWFRNMGNHKWEKHEYGGSTGNHDVVCGDINGDGKPDIVCQKGGSHLEWYKNPGNPTSNHSWSKVKIAGGIHGGAAPRGIGDLDGDGDNDVIRGDNWYENKDGKGGSWEAHKINHSIPKSPFDGGLAVRTWICDIDKDKKMDFVLAGCDISNGPVYWYKGDGSGGFSRKTIAENLNNDFHSLGVADFDNDGDLDVTAGGAREGSVKKVYIWENTDGKGNLKTHEIAKVWQSHELSVGDVDGDGDIDICSKGWGSGEIYFLQNKLDKATIIDYRLHAQPEGVSKISAYIVSDFRGRTILRQKGASMHSVNTLGKGPYIIRALTVEGIRIGKILVPGN
jgi:hypothetical protein